MAKRVVGDGPIAFYTDEGQQVLIPLSTISIDGDEVTTTMALEPAAALSAWLKHESKLGRIRAVPDEPPGEAMRITAVEPGTIGNHITVTIDGGATDTVDVTITSIDEYRGLRLVDLEPTLGSTRVTGSRVGLVQFKTPGTADPIEGDAAPTDPQSAPPSWIASGGANPAFTVEARRPGTDPLRVTVHVGNIAGAGAALTFTLTATWSVKVRGVTATNMEAPDGLVNQAAFIVRIEKPASGVYKLPKAGTIVTLSGGADPVARQATTTVLSA
jgi:hypothetical protein